MEPGLVNEMSSFWLEEPDIFFSIDADLRVEIRHGQHRETDLGIGEPGGAGALGVILKPPTYSMMKHVVIVMMITLCKYVAI